MLGRDLAVRPALAKSPWAVPAAVTAVVLAVLEVATFVAVARTIGVAWAAALLVVSSVVGVGLLRLEIGRNRDRLRACADQEQPLGPAVSDTVVGLFGAVLLVVPGFFSAALGLVLLLPPSRLLIRRLVERSAEHDDDLFGARRVRVRTGAPVEGEVVEIDAGR